MARRENNQINTIKLQNPEGRDTVQIMLLKGTTARQQGPLKIQLCQSTKRSINSKIGQNITFYQKCLSQSILPLFSYLAMDTSKSLRH